MDTKTDSVKVRHWQGREPIVVCVLVAAAGVIGAVLGMWREIPVLYPDEYIFGNIAQSLASGEGPLWRGQSTGLFANLYSYAIAPAWLGRSGAEAHGMAKVINAFVISSVALPTWLMAREFVGRRRALVPALLMLVGSWMVLSGGMMSENLGLPLSTATLASLAIGMKRQARKPILLAVGIWLLAAATRYHLFALGPIIVLALLFEIARQPSGSGKRGMFFVYRPFILGITGSLIAMAAVIVLDGGAVLGRFAAVTELVPSPVAFFGWVAQHLAALAVVVGVVPLVATGALIARKRNWRDDEIGQLLALAVPVIVVFVVVAGWFVAYLDQTGEEIWVIERYVIYCVPVVLTVFSASWGRILLRDGLLVSLLIAAAVVSLAIGDHFQAIEAPAINAGLAMFGASTPTGIGAAVALAIAVGALGLVGVLFIRVPTAAFNRQGVSKLGSPGVAAVVLVFAVLAGQLGSAWWDENSLSDRTRRDLPADKEWVNAITPGPVGAVTLNRKVDFVDYGTEFFNSAITTSYALPWARGADVGPTCTLYIEPDGALTTEPQCEPVPNKLLFRSGRLRGALRDEVSTVQQRHAGRLIIAAGRPRLLALLRDPCHGGKRCVGRLNVRFWIVKPAVVTLRFIGGVTDQFITVGKDSYRLPAGLRTAVNLPIQPVQPGLSARYSWNAVEGGPQLVTADLFEGKTVTRLY